MPYKIGSCFIDQSLDAARRQPSTNETCKAQVVGRLGTNKADYRYDDAIASQSFTYPRKPGGKCPETKQSQSAK